MGSYGGYGSGMGGYGSSYGGGSMVGRPYGGYNSYGAGIGGGYMGAPYGQGTLPGPPDPLSAQPFLSAMLCGHVASCKFCERDQHSSAQPNHCEVSPVFCYAVSS